MSKVSRYGAGIPVQSSDQERCPEKLFDANADVYTVEKPHNITHQLASAAYMLYKHQSVNPLSQMNAYILDHIKLLRNIRNATT
jgi:hypothetical protein